MGFVVLFFHSNSGLEVIKKKIILCNLLSEDQKIHHVNQSFFHSGKGALSLPSEQLNGAIVIINNNILHLELVPASSCFENI